MIQVPAHAYELQAKGIISAEEIAELGGMRDMLNKEASFGQNLAMGAGVAVGTAAAGALATATGHYFARGVAAAEDKFTFNRDLKSILAVHPDIKQDYSHKDIGLVYHSLRTLSPVVAKDPLMGGTLLGQILRSRDPSNPTAAPRFGGELQKMVAETGKSIAPAAMTQDMIRAFQSGVAVGSDAFLKGNAEDRREQFALGAEGRQQGFQRSMEVGKQDFMRAMETAKANDPVARRKLEVEEMKHKLLTARNKQESSRTSRLQEQIGSPAREGTAPPRREGLSFYQRQQQALSEALAAPGRRDGMGPDASVGEGDSRTLAERAGDALFHPGPVRRGRRSSNF